MATFKILVEGFAKEQKDGWIATPNTVLVEDSGKKILIDPGMDRDLLEKGLKKEGLKPNDIDMIYLSHRHTDHIANLRMFPYTDFGDPIERIKGKLIIDNSDTIPGTKIKIIQTPGHIEDHISFLIDTDKGKVCIAGDLFWWASHQEQKTDRDSLLHPKQSYAKDEKILIESRKKILDIADWIIPGHGKMFKVPK